MKKRIVYTAGTLLGLFLIGSIMQSRESRADGVYSSPVTVFNTTANPAITLGAEETGRQPYESSVSQLCAPGLGNCQFNFVGPGLGHRLVIQNVSGQITIAPGTTNAPYVTFNLANNNPNGGAIGNYWGIPAGPPVPNFGPLAAGFNQSVLAYVDGGGSAAVTVYTNHAGSSVATLSGYLQDCAIVPCPVAQH